MHPGSIRRHVIGTDDYFQNQVLMLAVSHAHEIMNEPVEKDNQDQMRLKAKATELLNQPDQFKERLALSVASLLEDDDVDERYEGVAIEDNILRILIDDAFDALAGVS